MSNALATVDLTQLPSTQIGNDEAYTELAKGTEFLGYIKLCSSDKYVKRNKIPNGHFGIPKSKEEIEGLGESIDILPLARRPKALDLSDLSAIVTSYDETSPEFQAIKAKSTKKDSGCQWGVSFLVVERSTGRFLEMFFGTASGRPEAANIFPYLPISQADIDRRAAAGVNVDSLEPHFAQPVTIKSKFAEDKQGHAWYKPEVIKCSTPFNKIPPTKAIVQEIGRFLSAKSGGVEKVPEPATTRAR